MKEDNKPQVHIGTIGHIDHGKTSWSEAIRQTLKMNKDNTANNVRPHAIIIGTCEPDEELRKRNNKKRVKRKKR